MPTPSVHQLLADRNQNVFDMLLGFQSGNNDIDCWVVIVAHGKALHDIEIAAHQAGIGGNSELISHADMLDFLAGKCVRAMQHFHRLHVISECFQYGVSSDDSVIQRAATFVKETSLRHVIPQWLNIIHEAIVPTKQS